MDGDKFKQVSQEYDNANIIEHEYDKHEYEKP